MIEMENLENPVVPAVDRALNILEFVAKAREPVSIKQVAQSLELPNTTAFRIVKQLSIRGYLEESESQPGCYHLGLQLLTLSNGMTYINNLRQVCHAELDHLAIESHQAVQMGILKGNHDLWWETASKMHRFLDENGFTVSQGEESAKLPWDQIYKMVATKSNVLVYSTRINAYIIPREQLGEQYKELAKIANEKLPKHRVKMQ